MAEFIVDFITLPSLSCCRSVLVDAASADEARLRALSTSTPWLCAEFFSGSVQLTVRDAPRWGEGASTEDMEARA